MLGVFDSGFGGMTVLRAIHERLPNVSTVYLGDNARAPYGTRSHEEIFAFALEGVRELFRRGCPLVILACNSASAQALRQIQREVLPNEFPDRRVLGVIRPTAEEIVSLSATRHIGVFATPATVASGSYPREIQGAVVTQVACPGLVDLIEAGRERSAEANELVATFCAQMVATDPAIDAVLLGCTHYPLVDGLFKKHVNASAEINPGGGSRRVVSQGAIVAEKLADYLVRHPDMAGRMDRTGSRTYLTTKNDETLSSLASRFYGDGVSFERVDIVPSR